MNKPRDVIGLVLLVAIGLMSYALGNSAGLKAAPAHFQMKAARAAADDAFWRELHAEHGDTSACTAIYDLVLQDLTGSETIPD